MATTTVRLDTHEERILDALAVSYGGRSNAIREAIRLLSARVERHTALDAFLSEWGNETGSVSEEAVEGLANYYDL